MASITHDILVTCVPGRDFASEVATIREHARRRDIACRVTVVCDGDCAMPTGIADRLVVHRSAQGIAFAVNEWVDYLRLTHRYYDGESTRTSKQLAARPAVCTMIQDDCIVNMDMLIFLFENLDAIFREADWFSGYLDPNHQVITTKRIANFQMAYMNMTAAVHLSAPFKHWCDVTPIPKAFGPPKASPGGDEYGPEIERGNPSRNPRLGSRVDHWLQADSGRRNGGTLIYPNGVVHRSLKSTWNA